MVTIASDAITDFAPNGHTVKSKMGSRNEVVNTALLSIFFDNPNPVAVDGIAVLNFESNGGRRLVRIGSNNYDANHRMLENTKNEKVFSTEVLLADPLSNPSMLPSVQPSGNPSASPSHVPSAGNTMTNDGAYFNPTMASLVWMTGAIMMVVAF